MRIHRLAVVSIAALISAFSWSRSLAQEKYVPLDWERGFVTQIVKSGRRTDPVYSIGNVRALDVLPDGRHALAAFTVDRGSAMDSELWLAPLLGGKLARLAKVLSAHIVDALPSKTGNEIAFLSQPISANRFDFNRMLYVVGRKNGDVHRVAEHAAGSPVWAGMGSELRFAVFGKSGTELCTATAVDRWHVKKMTDALFQGIVCLSPDVRYVGGEREGKVTTLDLQTGRQTRATPTFGSFAAGAWSADGAWLAFTTRRSHIVTVREHFAYHGPTGRVVRLDGDRLDAILGKPGPSQFVDVVSYTWMPGKANRLLLFARISRAPSDMVRPGDRHEGHPGKWIELDPENGAAVEASWMPRPREAEVVGRPWARYCSDGRSLLVFNGFGVGLYRRER